MSRDQSDSASRRCNRCRRLIKNHGKAFVLDGGTTRRLNICPSTKGQALGPA